MKSVLITGAAGKVGRVLAAAWAERYRLTLLDLVEPPSIAGANFLRADVNDFAALRSSLRNVNAVVHLAVAGQIGATWDEIVPTAFTGTWSVFQAACEAACDRVVFASSVMIQVLPRSAYSASKLWGESMAKCYTEAHDLSIICLRLGAVVAPSEPRLAVGDRGLPYMITLADTVQLFTCALEAPPDLRYGVFPGYSNNGHRQFRNDETRRALGYNPRDNAYALARRALLSPAGVQSLFRRSLRKVGRIFQGRD